jgi:RNA polymerase sigma factor (TIGR02999 family)
MRSVVVDHARRHAARKRGGSARRVELGEGMLRVEEDAAEILAIHQALERLALVDGRLGELVELRFFGGLSVEEAAGVLGVSDRTVKRDWTKARTLLYRFLNEGP